MLLHNQDLDQIYEYKGQKLYAKPVFSPCGNLWGFNLHIEGVSDLLGTFDGLEEVTAEIEAIQSTHATQYFIYGHCSYNGDDDFKEMVEKLNAMVNK